MNEAKKPTTMEANAREIHNIEFIAGLDAQLMQGQEILRDRLALVPNGWRNFRLAVTTTEKVLDGIYETLPMRTLKHMDRLCRHGEVVIRPKPMIKLPDDSQIVLSSDLRMLVNMVVAAECAVCLKSPPRTERLQTTKGAAEYSADCGGLPQRPVQLCGCGRCA